MHSSLRVAIVIAAKDLRERVRDRSALIVGVIAPLGLAAIFSLLIPAGADELNLRYALTDEDRGPIAEAFREGPLRALVAEGIVDLTEVDDAAAARRLLDAGEVSVALIVPDGFSQAVQAGEAAHIEVLGAADAPMSTEIASALARGFVAELDAIRLAVVTAAGDEAGPGRLAELAARAQQTPAPVQLVDAAADRRQVGTTTHFAAGMAIFFLFFTVQMGVLSLLAERRQGTLPRLVAAPIEPWAVIAGKALASFGLGLAAMGVLVVSTALLLGADWGSPAGIALLVVAAVVAAMGITAAITTLARTEEQAGGWNSIVAVSLAILGGAFFPVSQGPEILARLSLLTPHAWFLRGVNELSAETATLADIVPALVALTGFGLVTGAIGMVRARGLVVAR